MRQKFRPIVFCVLILLLASFLSFFALGNARRFHPDEAYYMTIARHAAVNGNWLLLAEPVDKTPLTFYTKALALVFFAIETDENGVLQLDALKGEFAGRMPSVLISILLVAVVIQLAKSISVKTVTPYIAGILVALSPMRIVFAPTAFTDLPMLLFGTISLWMALRSQWSWAGFWWIVSVAAKPQSVFYLPLILIILIVRSFETKTIKHILPKLIQFMLPIVVGMTVLWGWDALRVAHRVESFYSLGQSRYAPIMITPIQDYPMRFNLWWQTTQYLFGNGIVTAGLIGWALFGLVRHKARNPVLWGWTIGFFVVHIILTLNLFDRNQLVLLPVIIVLVSTAVSPKRIHPIFVVLVAFILSFSIQAARWQIPIGGDDGRHDGIHELANYLNDKPVATIIYDTWLDWELDYYMGQWTNKRRVFYPTPDLLVADALALDEAGTRYFVAPQSVNVTDWLNALELAGFAVELDYEMRNFNVYALTPPDS